MKALVTKRWVPMAATMIVAALAGGASADEAAAPTPAPAPAPSAPAGPPKVRLSITAEGFKGAKGQALVVVYDNGDKWLKIDKGYRVQKAKLDGSGRLHVDFDDVPVGVYAVSVIHDENVNGKLDMHWFPVPGPDEGAGVSNDATATFGPPKWGDARFRLGDKGGNIVLKIRY
jgi:uncharacterized protein (DUF2141 family)